MRYTVNDPDYKCSPFTGMTRRHWFDAARFLLEGAFTPVHTIDDPLVTPAYATLSEEEQAHHRYEGIVRTAILAIPLINEKPSLTIRGFSMQTYFSNWFLRLTEPNGKDTALTYGRYAKNGQTQQSTSRPSRAQCCVCYSMMRKPPSGRNTTKKKKNKSLISSNRTQFRPPVTTTGGSSMS
jgi:hypothetical protein